MANRVNPFTGEAVALDVEDLVRIGPQDSSRSNRQPTQQDYDFRDQLRARVRRWDEMRAELRGIVDTYRFLIDKLPVQRDSLLQLFNEQFAAAVKAGTSDPNVGLVERPDATFGLETPSIKAAMAAEVGRVRKEKGINITESSVFMRGDFRRLSEVQRLVIEDAGFMIGAYRDAVLLEDRTRGAERLDEADRIGRRIVDDIDSVTGGLWSKTIKELPGPEAEKGVKPVEKEQRAAPRP
ncbi:MAG TPA: hypothetical protein VJ547_12135 [Candidatus Thermoplasmatota archaeon]|nr:hypothetical protein [Candidatus Thermoplasmatota archaeon]